MAYALVAQLEKRPALNRHDAGSIPAGCTAVFEDEDEVPMQRLISLFREPDEAYALSEPPEEPAPLSAAELAQPPYFQQLLAHLREQRAAGKSDRDMVNA